MRFASTAPERVLTVLEVVMPIGSSLLFELGRTLIQSRVHASAKLDAVCMVATTPNPIYRFSSAAELATRSSDACALR